jgi:C4-dicarboxylate transporter DctM subunit
LIYLIIIGASIFSYAISLSQLPDIIVGSIEGLGLQPLVVILLLEAMYIVLGSIFDTVAAMVITLPFVFPLITGMGYDPIWWGVINVVVMEMGMITPPIGLNVFVLQGMAKDVPFSTIYAGIGPFLVSDVIRLLILTLFPVLTLWLPKAMGLM